MTKVIVRPVEPGDRDRWEPLWQGYNSFYGRPDFSTVISDVTWARFFNDSEPVYALVAERHGVLLGLTHYLFHRSTTTIGLTCYLQDLFTAPEARRLGVGEALIEAVAVRARDAGAERLYWQTHETNEAGRRLYDRVAERSGFIVYRKAL